MPQSLPSALLVGLSVMGVSYLLRRAQRARPPESLAGVRELHYPTLMTTLGIVATLFCAAGAAGSWATRGSDSIGSGRFTVAGGGPFIAAGFAAFGLLSLYLAIEGRTVFRLTDAELVRCPLIGRESAIRWNDLRRIDYDKKKGALRLVARSGDSIELAGVLPGRRIVASVILESAPTGALSPEARQSLALLAGSTN